MNAYFRLYSNQKVSFDNTYDYRFFFVTATIYRLRIDFIHKIELCTTWHGDYCTLCYFLNFNVKQLNCCNFRQIINKIAKNVTRVYKKNK